MVNTVFKIAWITLLVSFVILLFLPTPNPNQAQQATSTTLFLNIAAMALIVTAATGIVKLINHYNKKAAKPQTF